MDLEREIVGVKFIKNEEELEKSSSKKAIHKIPYCVMVKIASSGHCIKSDLSTSKCPGGNRALNLQAPSNEFKSGEEYFGFNMYQDLEIAKNVASNITLCKQASYGVDIRPLRKFHQTPDVVIAITNPYNAMRLVQGYTFKHGTQSSFKIAGNQALCGECTSYPFENNTINLSMLCSGTRYLSGWKTHEIAIGMSYSAFCDTVEGLYSSIDGSENDMNKKTIKSKLDNLGIDNAHIKYKNAYFMREKE